jgi:hypothetical protein
MKWFLEIEQTIHLQENQRAYKLTMQQRFKQEAALSVSPAESPRIKACLG